MYTYVYIYVCIMYHNSIIHRKTHETSTSSSKSLATDIDRIWEAVLGPSGDDLPAHLPK